MGDSPFLFFFLFLVLFFFIKWFTDSVEMRVFTALYRFQFLLLIDNSFTFDVPERSGIRLCRGATCQEYFRTSGHIKFFDNFFVVHPEVHDHLKLTGFNPWVSMLLIIMIGVFYMHWVTSTQVRSEVFQCYSTSL